VSDVSQQLKNFKDDVCCNKQNKKETKQNQKKRQRKKNALTFFLFVCV